jgi:hypothetical protein
MRFVLSAVYSNINATKKTALAHKKIKMLELKEYRKWTNPFESGQMTELILKFPGSERTKNRTTKTGNRQPATS